MKPKTKSVLCEQPTETDEEATEYDDWETQHALNRVIKEQFTNALYHGHGSGPQPGPKKTIPPSELVVPPKAKLLGNGSLSRKLFLLFRLTSTVLLGLCIVLGVVSAYGLGFAVVTDGEGRLGFGIYGAIVTAHMLLQSFMAWINKRQMEESKPSPGFPLQATSKIAIQISAHKEDPLYFRLCIESILSLNYPEKLLKVN